MTDRARQRRSKRRRAVTDVALELFERDGYDATTVEAIADAAGISLRSFYRYFESKDGVLATLGRELVDELIAGAPKQPTITGLALELARIFDEHLAERRVELLFRLLRERPELTARAALWRQQWTQQLAHGLAQRDARTQPSRDDTVISTIALSTVAIALDHWATQPDPAPISTHVQSILGLLQTRL